MYLKHWGIDHSPFRVDCDTSSYYAAPTHEEAQARLEFLVNARRRLGVLLGPSGIGKSLSLRVAAEQLRRAGRKVALVDAFGCSTREFLWQVAAELAATPREHDDTSRVWRLVADRIIENRLQNISTVLLVDNAGQASPDLLHQFLRVCRLDPAPDARLTTVLSALPGQAARWSPELRHLIDLRIDLVPWSEGDTVGYIQSALVDAGRLSPVFSDEALELLHVLSGGVPRQIARMADFALLAGAAAELELIDCDTIRAAHAEIEWTSAATV